MKHIETSIRPLQSNFLKVMIVCRDVIQNTHLLQNTTGNIVAGIMLSRQEADNCQIV